MRPSPSHMKFTLSNGGFALIDRADEKRLSRYRWWRSTKGYAIRSTEHGGVKKMIWMHRVILEANKNQEVDHRNMDRLDNRKKNLRLATPTQNRANQRVSRNNKLGFKGVSRNTGSSTFRAYIWIKGKYSHLGCFSTPEAANAAYFKAAKKAWGQFARAA